mgnify:CR=1 FL=1
MNARPGAVESECRSPLSEIRGDRAKLKLAFAAIGKCDRGLELAKITPSAVQGFMNVVVHRAWGQVCAESVVPRLGALKSRRWALSGN